MERTTANGALSDVSQVEASAGQGREGETLYRRPPVQLPADDPLPTPGTTGSSWFGTGGRGAQDEPAGASTDGSRPSDTRGDEVRSEGTGSEEAWAEGARSEGAWAEGAWSEPPRVERVAAERPAPRYGPTPPATAGRTSFGFSEGPISPGRTTSPDLPVRRKPATGRPLSGSAGLPSAGDLPPAGGRSSAESRPSSTARAAGTGSPVVASVEEGRGGSLPSPELPLRTHRPETGSDGEEPVAGMWPLPKRGSSGEFPTGPGSAAPDAAAGRPGSYPTGSDPVDAFTTGSRPHFPVAGPAGTATAGTGSYPFTGSGSVEALAPGPGSSSPGPDTFPGGYSTGSFSAADLVPGSRSTERGWPDNSVGNGRAGGDATGAGRASDPRDNGARPDNGRRPERADAGAGSRERPGQSLPPRQPRLVTLGMVVLGLVVVVAGTVIGVDYFSGNGSSSVLNLGGKKGAERTVSAPLDNRTTAGFELLAAVTTVHVTVGELGDDLYRISTPDDAGIRPVPVIKGDDVQLHVTKDGDGRGGQLDVVLSAAVRWELRFSGYADQQLIDLSNGQVGGVELVAGMHKVQLQLPTPNGTVPVRIAGSVEQLTLRSPADSPVRVKVGGGATTVVAGSRRLRNVPAGSTLVPKEWKTERNRYDVTAASAIDSLSVENLTQ